MRSPGRCLLLAIVSPLATGAFADDQASDTPLGWVAVVASAEMDEPLASWRKWRQHQGWEVISVAPARSNAATHQRVWRSLIDAGWKPGQAAAVMLVGSGRDPRIAPFRRPATEIARWGSERDIATDRPYGHHDNAGHASVGRVPFDSPSLVRAYAKRVMLRESAPTPDCPARLVIAASPGGFGPVIDTAIHGAAIGVLDTMTPPGWKVELRWLPREASGAGTYRESPTGAANPAKVWAYLGHAKRDRLAGAPRGTEADACAGATVAVLVACYAGDTATPQPRSVAQRMLAADNGPLAVIAATRVSMPYGNARIAAELLRGLGTPRPRTRTVGGLVQETATTAKAAATEPILRDLDRLASRLNEGGDLEAERQEHALMYRLLGDPLVQTPSTSRTVDSDQAVIARSIEREPARTAHRKAGTTR